VFAHHASALYEAGDLVVPVADDQADRARAAELNPEAIANHLRNKEAIAARRAVYGSNGISAESCAETDAEFCHSGNQGTTVVLGGERS